MSDSEAVLRRLTVRFGLYPLKLHVSLASVKDAVNYAIEYAT